VHQGQLDSRGHRYAKAKLVDGDNNFQVMFRAHLMLLRATLPSPGDDSLAGTLVEAGAVQKPAGRLELLADYAQAVLRNGFAACS